MGTACMVGRPILDMDLWWRGCHERRALPLPAIGEPMPNLAETTSEEVEQDEHAIDATEEKSDPFVTRVSLTIALLAVVGVTLGSLESVETSATSSANSAALLHQDRATDAWSAFEARSIRDMLARVAPAADGVRVVSRERHPDSDADALAATATEQERLSEEQLAEAERHERRHHVLTAAVTLVQVAIAIATIAIIARGQRWPWHAAVGLGLVGVATGAYAYL